MVSHSTLKLSFKKTTSFPGGPVVRIHLPMQETQVPSMVRELRSHMRATNPEHHNWRKAYTLQGRPSAAQIK